MHDNVLTCITINLDGDSVRVSGDHIESTAVALAAAIVEVLQKSDRKKEAALLRTTLRAARTAVETRANSGPIERLRAEDRHLLADSTVFQDVLPKLHEFADVQTQVDRTSSPTVKEKAQAALDVGQLEKAKDILAAKTALAAVGAPIAVAGAIAMYAGIGTLIYAGIRGGSSHSLVAPGWAATLGGGGVAFGVGIPVIVLVGSGEQCEGCQTPGRVLAYVGAGGLAVALLAGFTGLGFGGAALGDKVSILLSACHGSVCPASEAVDVANLHLNSTRADIWYKYTGIFAAAGGGLLVSGIVLNHNAFDDPHPRTIGQPSTSVSLRVSPQFVGLSGTF